MKYLILMFISITVGFGSMYGLHYVSRTTTLASANPLAFEEIEPSPSVFSTAHAPTDTISGYLTTLAGDTRWESRTATYPASISSTVNVGQGEKLVTGINGSMSVSFTDIVDLDLFSNTDLDIVQTLPNNFVFQQYEGTVKYRNKRNIPIAVRSLYLLQEINQGEARITVSRDPRVVDTTVITGQVTIAYNSLDFVSQVATIAAGKRFIFDDTTRELEIVNQ